MRRSGRVVALALALGGLLSAPPALLGQGPTMPSTLRYGSGLIDIPVASVLPHLQVTGTFSGFRTQLGRRVLIDASGRPAGFGPGREDILTDGSVAIGLWDHGEAGFTIQSLGDSDSGGNLWGAFARWRVFQPVDQGVGLAVGGRYLTSPTFGDGVEYAPGRLGFPDRRLRTSYTDVRGVDSNLSLYAVATAYLRGFDGGPLPENDLTVSLGYGGGMFAQGGGLDFYSDGHAGGWFMGTSLHVAVASRTQLTLMAEHNGFDVNVGAHVDWAGVRVGAQYLGANHYWPVDGHDSEYMKAKFGVLASIAICPSVRGLRCEPRSMRRTEPDTIYLPPPPPDTIVVEPEFAVPDGTPAAICLSTGQEIPIHITPVGDTLVGPEYVPLDDVQPAMQFAGTYAGDAFWYRDGNVVVFEGADFAPSDDVFPVDCGQILRVGIYQGVPVFSVLSARRPLDVIFIPVRPGLWRRYTR